MKWLVRFDALGPPFAVRPTGSTAVQDGMSFLNGDHTHPALFGGLAVAETTLGYGFDRRASRRPLLAILLNGPIANLFALLLGPIHTRLDALSNGF